MPTSLTTAHHEWNKRWADEGERASWLNPEPAVQALFNEHFGEQAQQATVTVADVGCGVGRHSLFYARQGAQVIACDGSSEGLDFGRQQALREGINDRLNWQQTAFDHIPCPDQHCDLILAWNVIYHGSHDDLLRCLHEMHRAIKPGGLIQLTLLSKRNSNFGIGMEVAPDTWINIDNPEKSHAHCYTNAADLTRLLGDRFELLSCVDREHKYPGSKSWHWEIVAEAR